MAGAIRRDRPRRFVGVGNLQVNRPSVVAQPHQPGTLQSVRIRSDDVGDTVSALNVRGRFGHDQKRAPLQDRVRRKCKINIAGQPIPADVLEERIGVKQLDVFQRCAVGARRGLIHDLGNDQAGLAAGGTERFPRQCQRTAPGCGRDPEVACWNGRGRRPVPGRARLQGGGERKKNGDQPERSPEELLPDGLGNPGSSRMFPGNFHISPDGFAGEYMKLNLEINSTPCSTAW